MVSAGPPDTHPTEVSAGPPHTHPAEVSVGPSHTHPAVRVTRTYEVRVQYINRTAVGTRRVACSNTRVSTSHLTTLN